MSSSIGRIIPYISIYEMENKVHVPKHQPVINTINQLFWEIPNGKPPCDVTGASVATPFKIKIFKASRLG